MAEEEPAGHEYPAKHGPSHDELVAEFESSLELNRPALQGPVHEALPMASVAPNRPDGQKMQLELPPKLYLPARQLSAVPDVVPGRHL